MAHDDDLSSQPDEQTSVAARMSELRSQFATFLSKRGIVLEYDLGIERAEISRRLMIILRLVGLKLTTEAFREHEPGRYDQVLASKRRDALELLWNKGRLVTPWTDLVDHEFRGAPLTEADLEGFIAAAPDQVVLDMEIEDEYQGIVDELVRFFVEHGYDPQETDLVLLTAEAFRVWCERHREYITATTGHLGQLLETIRGQASQPEHPVWPAFLRQFLPSYMG